MFAEKKEEGKSVEKDKKKGKKRMDENEEQERWREE